jgi:predicted nucleotidyltransferase
MLDERLASLPQAAALHRAAESLAANIDVDAVWLGGSFASGSADRFSDVDLRIAVVPERLSSWRDIDFRAIFNQAALGASIASFGDDAFLHHLVLEDGTIFDLFVQTTCRDNHEHAVKILSCRDDAFGERLATFGRQISGELPPPDAPAISKLVVSFWINSYKHRKVLGRGLPLLAAVGVQLERMSMLRLWTALVTGRDGGDRMSIHGLSATTRVVHADDKLHALQTFGLPLRTPDEVIAAIEANRDAVASAGRLLAARLAFEYPDKLERLVRSSWAEFRATVSEHTRT